MKTCEECGKPFTPRHGNQKICPGCKMERLTTKKKRTPTRIKAKYGTYHGKNWRCSIFPNCESCPFEDCLDGTNREFVEITDET